MTVYCIDCRHHKIIPDPDPKDRFNDDDVAVVCKEMLNGKRDFASPYLSERNEFASISVSVRPYNLREESIVPKWCPFRVGEINV